MAVFRSSFSGVVGVLSSLGDIFVQRVLIIEIWGLFSGAVGVLSLAGVIFVQRTMSLRNSVGAHFRELSECISKGYVVMELIFGSGNDW